MNQSLTKQISYKQKKMNRQEKIDSFFENIDSGNYFHFIEEESFIEFTNTVKEKAIFLQKGVKLTGNDHIQFKILFPISFLCACLSQMNFNRKSDVNFRCYENWFTVDILISNKEDLIFLLGEAGLQNVVHYEGCYSELVVSKLFPAKLNFSSQTDTLKVDLDIIHYSKNEDVVEYCKGSFHESICF